MKKAYFDYAATTPASPEVIKAMAPYLSKAFGNPGSLHFFGQEASSAVFSSRRKIADILRCDSSEIIFTGSATEANNLALRGAMKQWRTKNNQKPKIIVSSIEHESVLATCGDLEKDGAEIVYVPVSGEGIVDLKKLENSLDENTVLVSVMFVNNEIGTIQPIEEISKIIKNFRKEKIYPLFHTDAAQAFNYLPCVPGELGIDLMTLSGHKIYGPKGIGLLYVKGLGFRVKGLVKNNLTPNPSTLYPLITGGGQESGLRSGTENTAAIAGFAKAMEIADKIRKKEAERILKLREYFLCRAEKLLPALKVNGSIKQRIPNNLNFYFPGFKAQDLLIKLDLAGFAVSAGSACSARASEPSYVVKALGYSAERASESIRISFGRETVKGQIDDFIKVLKNIIKSRK